MPIADTMASSKEGSELTKVNDVGPEKDLLKSEGGARKYFGKSKRAAKQSNKLPVPTTSKTNKSSKKDLEDTTSKRKPRSLMRKMSSSERERKTQAISNNDEFITKSSKSDEVYNQAPNSLLEVESNSVEALSLTTEENEGLSINLTMPDTSDCPRDNKDNNLNCKEKKSRVMKFTKSPSTRKKIAINAAGESIDFEYVGEKSQSRQGNSVSIYKASVTHKAARTFLGMNLFKKEPSKISKGEKENNKTVTAATENSCSSSVTEEIALTNNVQGLESSTLASKEISVDINSTDNVDDVGQFQKSKNSDEEADKEELEIRNPQNTGTNESQLHRVDTVNGRASLSNQSSFRHAIKLGCDENSFEIPELPDKESISIKTDKLQKFRGESVSSNTEMHSVEFPLLTQVIDYNEEEKKETSKSCSEVGNQDEKAQENIDPTEISSVNSKAKTKAKLERDHSLFNLPRILMKMSTETEPTSSQDDPEKCENGNVPDFELKDHDREQKSNPLGRLIKSGPRSSVKNRKANTRTLGGPEKFLVKYMRVHGEADGAYENKSEPRGLIFMKNIESFNGGKFNFRNGSEEDFVNLMSLFKQMGYLPAENLCESGNITKDKLIKDLKTFSKMKHKNYDSTIIIIMSHGIEDNTFVTSDEKEIPLSKLYSQLNNNNCKDLQNKPKIFIFQFCRPHLQRQCSVQLVNSEGHGLSISIAKPGKKTDLRKLLLNFFTVQGIKDQKFDVNIDEDSDSDVENEELMTAVKTNPPAMVTDAKNPFASADPDPTPDYSDMYSIFATQAGGVAYRDPRKGSLMIQAICDVFSEYAFQDDIDALVRKVSKHVQNKIAGLQKEKPPASNHRGVVERVNSGLDKLFYFNPYPNGVMKDGKLSDPNMSTQS